ncbi:MAG TPA: Mur ligase domain-containing protein, partial [bacterium]|nr:Mur ligase domain-containing protein [bacterium]
MKVKEIADLINGEVQGLPPETYIVSIGTDSRMVDRGGLFFALKGENNDGHNFIRQAINNGAIGAVMHNRLPYPGIIVEDTADALFNLSGGIRERYPIPLIGVAGSSGKTTSKELIYLVLG